MKRIVKAKTFSEAKKKIEAAEELGFDYELRTVGNWVGKTGNRSEIPIFGSHQIDPESIDGKYATSTIDGEETEIRPQEDGMINLELQ